MKENRENIHWFIDEYGNLSIKYGDNKRISEQRLGYCVGILKPNEIIFTSTSLNPPTIGQFVLILSRDEGVDRKEFPYVLILGMIKNIERFDRFISRKC